jgi:hypothetical protein
MSVKPKKFLLDAWHFLGALLGLLAELQQTMTLACEPRDVSLRATSGNV